jgi:hypothetical protein
MMMVMKILRSQRSHSKNYSKERDRLVFKLVRMKWKMNQNRSQSNQKSQSIRLNQERVKKRRKRPTQAVMVPSTSLAH